MFGYKIVKKEDWEYLNSLNELLHKEITVKENWQKEYNRAMSDYAESRREMIEATIIIAKLTSELQQVREEKEKLEKQVHDYLLSESLMR